MKPKSHWTPRYWLAFPLLLVSLAWFVAYADDPKPEKESSDSQPAMESSAEPQETVTDTSTAPDKKETKEQPAQPTDPNLNKPSTETTFPGNAFGGGGGGGGGFGGGGVVSGPPHNYLMNSNVTLTWNKEKTVYWGYSNLLGTWASIRLPENSGAAIPLLSSDIMCLQLKDRIYSFSSRLGKWTSVDLPKDSGKVLPMISSNVAVFRLKDRVYGFSAAVGKWEELKVNDPADPALLPDSIVVTDGDKIHIFSEKTGRWASPGEDESKLLKIQFHNFPSLVGQTDPQAPPVTTSTSPAPVTIPGPSVVYATQSGLTQQQAHVAATAVLTQPQNLWRRRADLYRQSARELLLSMRGLDRQSPDIVETQERMKKEYDELLHLTIDAQLNAQKEEAQLLKARLARIEAQITENEKDKEEMVKKLDLQIHQPGIELRVTPAGSNGEPEFPDSLNPDKNDKPKSQIFDFKAGFTR